MVRGAGLRRDSGAVGAPRRGGEPGTLGTRRPRRTGAHWTRLRPSLRSPARRPEGRGLHLYPPGPGAGKAARRGAIKGGRGEARVSSGCEPALAPPDAGDNRFRRPRDAGGRRELGSRPPPCPSPPTRPAGAIHIPEGRFAREGSPEGSGCADRRRQNSLLRVRSQLRTAEGPCLACALHGPGLVPCPGPVCSHQSYLFTTPAMC